MALIIVRKNGPYRVHGPVVLQDAQGHEIVPPGEVFTLCRCGHSKTKPFCDGSHKVVGFSDVNPEPPPPPQPPAP